MTDQCHSALEQPEIRGWEAKGLVQGSAPSAAPGMLWGGSGLHEALLNQAVCLPYDSSLGSKKWNMGAAEGDW